MDSPAPSQKMIPPTCLRKSEICASFFISPSLPMNLISQIPLDGSSQQFPITLYSSIITSVWSFIFSPWSILVASLLDDYSYFSSVCVNGWHLGAKVFYYLGLTAVGQGIYQEFSYQEHRGVPTFNITVTMTMKTLVLLTGKEGPWWYDQQAMLWNGLPPVAFPVLSSFVPSNTSFPTFYCFSDFHSMSYIFSSLLDKLLQNFLKITMY